MIQHKTNLLFLLLLMGSNLFGQQISSPNKKITVQFSIKDKKAGYRIQLDNKEVLGNSALGVVREDGDFSQNLSFVKADKPVLVKDSYESLNAKKSHIEYVANRQVIHLANQQGKKMDIIFQVSNDGVAFRYYFPETSADIKKIGEEKTTFKLPTNTKAWLQPMSDAQTGWEHCHPSYEEFYEKDILAGITSPIKAGWVYPALFKTPNAWVLLTETGLDGSYCATRLKAESPNNEYQIGFPQSPEVFTGGVLNPQSRLPWYSPWRIITIGSLKTIMESTLGTDLANPAIKVDTSFIKPGIASWSWILLKDESVNYETTHQYIDHAADMHWDYCLIDADWDTRIGYERIKELADYAKTKNVKLLVWYNSAGAWNTTPYHPRNMLLTSEGRKAEFKRIKSLGVSGVKIDFFAGDGQSMIQYYLDILKDAAEAKLLVNFHGATLPRGWARTFPHLMSAEAVKGFEMVTFDQKAADEQPAHCTTLPFTRNIFDPMDFTPMALYKIPNIKRRTSTGFELALSVVFLSGIQHLAESPEGMTHVPPFAKSFLQQLPTHWDEVRFIDGFPGKLVVLARRTGSKWYVTGINGEGVSKDLTLDLSFLKNKKGQLISDKNAQDLQESTLSIPANGQVKMTLLPNGGFVAIF
jgi:alpha-glucosidase